MNINLGKTRVWNAGGLTPMGFEGMGSPEQPVWVGDQSLPPEQQGLVVLGTPHGHRAYVTRHLEDLSAEHQRLLDVLHELPELQSSWLLLSLCASPRCNYYLRALPPSLSAPFAVRHDLALRDCLLRILDNPAAVEATLARAGEVAQLPFKHGGLGLRCAARLAQAAYWASWADCLPMVHQRHPPIAQFLQHSLDLAEDMQATADCLQEARLARATLLHEGFDECPSARQILDGARPRQPTSPDVGEWSHGWQYWAAGARDAYARTHFFRANRSDPTFRTLLRSQSGRGSGRVFTVLPTSPATTLSSAELRVLLLRRLRLPLPLAPRRCHCGRALDEVGDHRCACSTCGVLRRRAIPLEKALARVCREAGARVAENVLLRDLNLQGISSRDSRQIEVVANGLPLWGGAQLAVDATFVSPIRRNGRPQPHAADTDGIQLRTARRRKEQKYAELLRSRRCRLVVIGIETGGRWSEEALQFVRLLARCKARAYPRILRKSAQLAWSSRWLGVLAVAAHRALAHTLLELPVSEAGCDGDAPCFEDVLHDARLAEAPSPSRLPA